MILKHNFLYIYLLVLVMLFFSDKPITNKQSAGNQAGPDEIYFFSKMYPDSRFPTNAIRTAYREATDFGRQKDGTLPSQLSWFPEGPTNIGGRINVVLPDPNHPDTIYSGNATGGIFKSTNGGQSWFPVFDDNAYLSIGSLCFDPLNSDILYAGTGDPNISGYPFIGNGIYRSSNGGATWENLGLENTGIVSKILVHPQNTDTLFAATMGIPFEADSLRGLYRSTDGGLNWSKILFVDTDAGIIDLIMEPGNPNTLYAASWNRIRNNSTSIAYGPDAKIYKSTDGGDSWTVLSNGLPQTNASRIGLAISATNPQILYALYVSTSYQVENIYKSSDGGLNWTALPYNNIFSYALGGFGWYFGQIRVSPYNPNELFLLGVDLYKSTNGGNSWFAAGPNWATYLFHADKHDLVYLDSLTLLCSTDGGLYKSIDGGLSWTDIEDIPNCQFYRVAVDPHNPGYYGGGLQDNGTVYGNQLDPGNWQRLNGGDGFQILFDYTDSDIMYSESQNGALYYTTGSNWQYFGTGIDGADRRSWDMPFMMSAHNPKTLYTGTYRVYKIKNAPLNQWFPISPDLTEGINNRYHVITTLSESPLDSAVLYSGASDGEVYRSLDTGATWTSVNSNLPDRYVTHILASPNFATAVFVSHSGYKDNDFIPHIHYSQDYGSTWTDISGDLPPLAINNIYSLPGYADQFIFVASDGGVYFTDNGGVKWVRLGNNMPMVPVYDIDFDPVNQKIIAGTYARSMYSVSIDSMMMVLSANSDLETKEALKLFPNPAHDLIYIREKAVDASDYMIFSMDGRLQKTGKLTSLSNGIEISSLKKGCYLFSISTSSGIKSGKFIRQ